MLQAIMNQNALLYGVVVLSVLGGLSQIILNSIYRRVIKDIGNMAAPRGKLMRHIKERYQSFRRSNENTLSYVSIFLEKSIMEYKFLGMSLHTWRRLGGIAFLICAVMGIGGYYISGTMEMAVQARQNYLWSVLASAVLIAGIYGLTDVSYKRRYLKTGLESVYANTQVGQAPQQAYQEIDLTEKRDLTEKKTTPIESTMQPRRKRGKMVQTKAQRDKQELKENLAKLKEGISETAASVERNKERNTEILRQMDSAEQERVIREVLKEFLS